MFDYIKAALRWILRLETLKNALFAVRIANNIYGKLGAKLPKKYGKEIKRKLEIAQEAMDSIQSALPNELTNQWAEKITSSQDIKTWGDFKAAISPSKHGQGNDGINLSLQGEIKGVPYKIGYTLDNGGIEASSSLFSI